MTQSFITTTEEAKNLFKQVEPKPVVEVDILEKGKNSLKEANFSLGLALSSEEIDYLYWQISNCCSQKCITYPYCEKNHSFCKKVNCQNFTF